MTKPVTKLDIEKAIVDGFQVIRSKPIVMLPLVISSIVWILLGYYVNSTIGIEEFSNPAAEEVIDEQAIEELKNEILSVLPLLIALLIAGGLLSLFLDGLAIRMIYDVATNKPPSESIGFAARKYLTLLLASTLMIIVALPAFLLFVVPGIYLSVRFSYVMHAVLIDGEGVIGSLKKSWRVVKGNWWRTFVLGIIVMVFVLIARFTIVSLLVVVSFTGEEAIEVVGNILDIVVDGVVGTWTVAAFVMAYLQLTGRQRTPEDEVLAQP